MSLYRVASMLLTCGSFAFLLYSGQTSLWVRVAVVVLNVAVWIVVMIEGPGTDASTQTLKRAEDCVTKGNYREAEDLYLVADRMLVKRGAKLRRVTLQYSLADVLRRQKRFEDADSAVKLALHLLSEASRETGPEYARCLALRAAIRGAMGQHEEAQKLFQKSIALEQAIPKPNRQIIAKRYLELGVANLRAHDAKAATINFIRSLDLHDEAFGTHHAETSYMVVQAAALYQKESQFGKAIPFLRRAKEIQDHTHGADSKEAFEILLRLAKCCLESGAHSEASNLFEEALRRCYGNQAVSPEEVITVEYNLARV
jgi:tetratricopeptide (TPR) repeat protein